MVLLFTFACGLFEHVASVQVVKKHAIVCANTSAMFSVHEDHYNLQCFKHGAQKCSNLFKLHVTQLTCIPRT